MYEWRKLSDAQRVDVLRHRQLLHRPWHNPPHFQPDGPEYFHLTAACYNHLPIIGKSIDRMARFEAALVDLFISKSESLAAWCILPNHWHALVKTAKLKELVKEVGLLHGSVSFQWNGEDQLRGRKCWHGCADRRIRSARHFYVAQNYIHHNSVKHGHIETSEEWPFSSAADYMEQVGRENVVKQWDEYPVLDMGDGWDD
jgi:putative transposase